MNDKQIFTAIEVADYEVRLIVGEFFNTRFNIIKVERVACDGFDGEKVVNAEAITKAIQTAVENAKKMIGASIKSAILAVPSYGMKRYSFKSTVDVAGIDGTVTVQDVRNAMKKAQRMDIGKDYALIQTVNVKYTVNGITTRRIPIGERCHQLMVDIDLLCANRTMAYDLVTCIEKSGIKIMDIFLDTYAVGKEAALFEQAVNKQIIILKMERQSTSLGLLRNGRMTTAMVFPAGVGYLASGLLEKHAGINYEQAVELVKYSAVLNEKELTDNSVHIWTENGETKTLTEKELVESVLPTAQDWLKYVKKLCSPILQAGETTVIITGEGGETQGLSNLLGDILHTEVKTYVPDTLGGRNAGLSSCLGLFYAYQDRMPIMGYNDESIDMDAFIKAVSYKEKKNDGNTKEDTLTSKLKGLFLENRK